MSRLLTVLSYDNSTIAPIVDLHQSEAQDLET